MDDIHGHEEARIAYVKLVRQAIRVLDGLAVAEPEVGTLSVCERELRSVADQLEALPELPENPDVAAHSGENARFTPNERGLVPAVEMEIENGAELSGRVEFSAFYGGTVSVHGGAIALFFDDFLGRLANEAPMSSVARTAHLGVDYRALTPCRTPLRCRASLVKVDGRKLYLWGSLEDLNGVQLSTASGLWIRPRPFQGTENGAPKIKHPHD